MKKKKRTNNRYTTEDLELMGSGKYTITELAEIFEVSKQSIDACMKRYGIVNKSRGARLTEEKKEKIRKLLDDGNNAAAIARMMGVSDNTVNRLRREKCYIIQKRSANVEFKDVLQFMKLRAEGLSYSKIAEKTGYSHTTVYRWLERKGEK